MADTLQDTPLTKGVWVDLYAATGISTALAISIQNVGASEVRLYAGAAEPASGAGGRLVTAYGQAENQAEDNGAWAISRSSDGLINVREA